MALESSNQQQYTATDAGKRLILLEDLTRFVLWLLFTILTVNMLFLTFVMYRRLARKRYYAVKDSARDRYQHVIAKFLRGELEVSQTASLLEEATSQPEQDALEEMLLNAPPEQRARISELLFALGNVERWARTAFGYRRGRTFVQRAFRGDAPLGTGPANRWNPILRLRFFSVPRAIAIERLGSLTPLLATYFSTEALADPAFEVQRTAIGVLGRHRVPAAIPQLVKELQRAVEQASDLSLRSVKAALVSYRIDDLPWFLPVLEHPNSRVRFFLVDAIREICLHAARTLPLTKNDFSQPFYELFLDQMSADTSADVRARSAAVIGYFRDQRAAQVLRRLLTDENEFVRLHATRACADRLFATLVPDLLRRLEDPKWRVRESAARALRAMDRDGFDELLRLFIATTDRYTAEQIIDEIQRSGTVEDVVSSLVPGNADFALAEAVCRKMVQMGKTSLLLNALASSGVPDEARAVMMDAIALAPPPEFYPLLQALSQHESALGFKAASVMSASAVRRAAVGGVDA